jgi:hypothetical protein
MRTKSYRIFFTVDEELYGLLEEQSRNQVRKLGDTARFLMVKGMQAEKLLPVIQADNAQSEAIAFNEQSS